MPSTRVKRAIDEDTGLTYTEREVRKPLTRPRWMWIRHANAKDFKKKKNKDWGSRSLLDTAYRQLCLHTDSLTVENLRDLPVHLANALWRLITERKFDHFDLWKVFADAHGNDEEAKAIMYNGASYGACSSAARAADWLNIIQPETKLSMNWLTILTLIEVYVPRLSLIELSAMKNLGALSIIAPEARSPRRDDSTVKGHFVTDGMVRAWADAAHEAGAFSMLKVLMLIDQEGLTRKALHYLLTFPVLSTFTVNGQSFEDANDGVPIQKGWTKPMTLREYPALGDMVNGHLVPRANNLLGVETKMPMFEFKAQTATKRYHRRLFRWIRFIRAKASREQREAPIQRRGTSNREYAQQMKTIKASKSRDFQDTLATFGPTTTQSEEDPDLNRTSWKEKGRGETNPVRKRRRRG